ncbi:hypothetical protein C1I95_25215 [Micromonospora craterilacus]|uniref:Restriction endonuclease type IV Mrr domain-containing protein n=1 Tax=Micromonospora craterilacus TaxID=1655439 RepID=A0A2W2DQ14_9ACTN|nr:hypothetical protein C1I95_25215 [Micromonospora craterilacus]
MRIALHEHPELLARLDFSQVKRSVAGMVVQLLAQDARYHQTTLQMMTELAEMTVFPNLASQVDADQLTARARSAIETLRKITKQYRADLDGQERVQAQKRVTEVRQAAQRRFDDALMEVKAEFLTLSASTDPQGRGRQFEAVLYRLLDLHDMQPRIAYNVPFEQIDGSFTFNTDDYLLEAKWCQARIERDQADVFAAKVQRKGRNTLGLFVSISGFTQGFLEIPHAQGCPFITLDGDDLFLVLDARIGLDEVLQRKRRHLNDTGRCHIAVRSFAR